MAASFFLATGAIWSIASLGPSIALFAVIGLVLAPPGGLIMALPGEAVRPERRALAMGLYFTSYYAGMGVLPTVAGYARDVTGNAAAPLWFAGAMLVAGLLSPQFRLLQARPGQLPATLRSRIDLQLCAKRAVRRGSLANVVYL